MNLESIKSILYIDDDYENLLGFETSFSRDYKVFTAENTQGAHQILLAEQNIGVVLVDYKMPHEDGISFVKRVKDEFPNIIFIITSAWADMDVVVKALNLNSFYSFVQKPWNYDELRITIKNAIDYSVSKIENERLNEILKIKNRELTESVAREKEANNVKNVFLQNISHEIRTPLNGILGFSSLIKSNSQEDDSKTYAEFIRQGGCELLKTIQRIVDTSLILTNQVEIHNEELALSNSVSGIIEENMELISKKNISIKNNIPLGTNIFSDRFKIEQVLGILIDNAVKFTEKGEIEINYVNPNQNGFLAIEIRDTGIGVEPQKLSLIFEPFRQCDETYTRKYSGIGMGLFIAKSYAKMLGGDITVNSIIGKGSSFLFKFKSFQ